MSAPLPPPRFAMVDEDSPLQLIIVTDQRYLAEMHARWARLLRGARGRGYLAEHLEAMASHVWQAKRCLDKAAESVLDTEAEQARGTTLAARAAAARSVS